jgi:arabinogalactan oligomer/maltooligosaccharide transport system permease protein
MTSARERLLYPLKIAALLILGSLVVYISFSIFPIAYSVYIAFTDASAKNIAPGPRLYELREAKSRITEYLESRKDYIVGEAVKAKTLVDETITILDELSTTIASATPENISVAAINRMRGDVDGRLLEVKSIVVSESTKLYLDPSIVNPLDRALRTLDYRVWQPVDQLLLYKIHVTEEDLARLKETVLPAVNEAKILLGEASQSLELVGSNYKGFIGRAMGEIDRQIDELTLHFVGLENFRRLFDNPRFPYSLFKTLLFVVTSVPLKMIAGVTLAIIYTSPLILGRRFTRGLLLLPWAIPILLSVTTWRILFTPERGFLSSTIEGLLGYRVDIYVNEWHAFALYNIVEVWLAYPFVMTVTMAALASIPREYLEAALVDGARTFQTLRSVVLPLILRPLAFAAILTTGASLQAFMIPLLINNGGPAKSISLPGYTPTTGYSNEMMVLYGYNRAWLDQDYGLSAATFLVVVSILLVYAVAWYYLLYRRGWASV